MQFDNTNKTQAIQAFNQLAAPLQQQMQLSSVRLSNGNFTGSGVLVIDGENIRGIVTAKHNLCVKAGIQTPLIWNDTQVNDLAAGFLTNLLVGFGPLSQPLTPQNLPVPTLTQALTPTTADIEFRGGYGSWDYDLMFISFKAAMPLRNYIDANVSHRIAYGRADLQFYQGNMVNRGVFVTGFGDILNAQGQQTSMTHAFQVRTATVTRQEPRVRRHQNPNADFDDVLIAGASYNTSTAPGDSGGPMLTVANNRVYLLGATLGSNFLPNQMVNDNPIVNNASTFLYRQGALF
ncbi:trypsin-like serine protease [Chitinimonas koreensis]|uniref:trypsin-like serine protease n=1 Tax=Chitinimonas koreensis TaxID=356302 RepID=UPI0004259912|nr:trypsin-like serine protease [Chitinimonas koreensis]QNM98010.1 trypsin-like serine protease [Chitinimonas koreensis]